MLALAGDTVVGAVFLQDVSTMESSDDRQPRWRKRLAGIRDVETSVRGLNSMADREYAPEEFVAISKFATPALCRNRPEYRGLGRYLLRNCLSWVQNLPRLVREENGVLVRRTRKACLEVLTSKATARARYLYQTEGGWLVKTSKGDSEEDLEVYIF